MLARARREQSWPSLGDGGADAGRTIGSQITPKTFLRCVNYGDSFAIDFEKTAWYFDLHFIRFSAYFFYCPSATFGFILLYQIICRNHLTSNHQPSEGPWFMGPSDPAALTPSPHLKTVPTPLHGTD